MMHQAIGIRLVNETIWRKFSPATEMILTKQGRRLFPLLEYQVSGLNPKEFYAFELRMERCDDNKYTFDDGEWQESHKRELHVVNKSIRHSDGFQSGKDWMATTVSFARCKITNNPVETKPTHIFLQSMYKYIPVLSIFKMNSSPCEPEMIGTYSFHFTAFYAVTMYQNPVIVRLKKENNKFASGFLLKRNRKRFRTDSPDALNENIPFPKMPWMGHDFGHHYPFPATFAPSEASMAAMRMNQGLNALQQYQPQPFHQQNGPQFNAIMLQQQHQYQQQPSDLHFQQNQVQYPVGHYHETVENFDPVHYLNPQYAQYPGPTPTFSVHPYPPQHYFDNHVRLEMPHQMQPYDNQGFYAFPVDNNTSASSSSDSSYRSM